MDAVALMGQYHQADCRRRRRTTNRIGCAKLVVFANAVEDNPFMAGAFHGTGEPECVINVGVSGPGVVQSAIRRAGECPFNEVAEIIKKTAFKITRMGQLVGARGERSGWACRSALSTCRSRRRPAIGDSRRAHPGGNRP